MKHLLTITLLLLTSTISAADKTSTAEEFQEFADAMTGRFRSDIRLIHDWPFHEKKKGDLIKGLRTGQSIAEGMGFFCTDTAGAGNLSEMYFYNASTQQIQCNGVANGGTSWHVDLWKAKDNHWGWKLTGSLPDGTSMKGSGTWVILDGGKQIDLISEGFTIGDEKTDPLHDRYYRISASSGQSSQRSLEELHQAMQGKWIREWKNNEGESLRREKVIQGYTETITDYDQENNKVRGWTVPFQLARVAGKYHVFRNQAVYYIFDVDENYWYEIHDLKKSKSMLPAFRREKQATLQNANTLKGLEKWVGKWRGEFTPQPLKGYTDQAHGTLQVDFHVAKNKLGTTATFAWIESRKDTGEVVETVNGYVAWSPAQKTHVIHFINSSGVNVSGTISLRPNVHLMERGGDGPEGKFSETCILQFPDADTMVHKITNRVHNGTASDDATPVTLRRVQ